ncbi:MAG: response regulator, partial [Methanobacteriota archaeon]
MRARAPLASCVCVCARALLLQLADNGRQAVEYAAAQPFDFIILDVLMPEMGGDEALRILRRRGVKTPIYMVTANALPTQRDSYLRLGATGVIHKPWTFQTIRKAILDSLGGSSGAPRPKTSASVTGSEESRASRLITDASSVGSRGRMRTKTPPPSMTVPLAPPAAITPAQATAIEAGV